MPLLLVALALAAGPTAFAAPLNCDSAVVQTVRAVPAQGRLVLRAVLSTAIDPATSGLGLRLVDPAAEGSAAGVFLDATLPADGFRAKGRRARYRDRSGAQGGITGVRLKAGRNGTKLVVTRKGDALPPAASALRLTVTAGAACARTCASACTAKGRALRCRKGPAGPACGLEAGCEPLGVGPDGTSRHCLLPYPSDFFTRADAATATGRRLAYPAIAMPANDDGVPIDPTRYNRLDGFSPGPIAMAHFAAGVDLAASAVPPPTDFAASLDPASPTLLIEADAPGCVRVEHFGENDVSAGNDGATPVAPPDQLFMIRPGRRLRNATRYVVALRNLVGQDGQPLAAGPAFAAYRDGTATDDPALEARRPAMDALLAKLETDCGVPRAELVLAWGFTTASDDSIQRYLLHMRDQSFAALPGTTAPPFTVTQVENDPFEGDARVCRRVRGVYTVPLWTTYNGPGSVLNVDPATDLPVQNGVATDVPFTAMIPCSLVTPTPTAGRPIVYGHGLLGSGDGEVTAGNLRTLADTYGFVVAATDWQGFSELDVPAILGFIGDLSGFPQLSERLHQGVLNQLVLARLLRSPDGFVTDPAFRVGATPLIDTTAVYYYGNSQGGIEGGPVMALGQDVTRGVLGVAAANYSTLLHRSRDFEPFFVVLRGAYPDPVARGLALAVIQQLWDRSEPNGWYHRIVADPLPNTPAHRVLVHMARADDEVSNLATEIMVRSMGIPQLAPGNQTYFGIPQMAAPFDGSAFVEAEFGEPPPPVTNTPPADNEVHGAMRGLPAIQAQIDAFLRPDGVVQQFCAGPCDPE